jgi:hypothetical protein
MRSGGTLGGMALMEIKTEAFRRSRDQIGR